ASVRNIDRSAVFGLYHVDPPEGVHVRHVLGPGRESALPYDILELPRFGDVLLHQLVVAHYPPALPYSQLGADPCEIGVLKSRQVFVDEFQGDTDLSPAFDLATGEIAH